MRRVGLVIKSGQARLADLARELIGWLASKGLAVAVEEEFLARLQADQVVPLSPLACWQQDLIIVLGGDGTLLRAARLVGLSGVPLLGVNLGGLGFLTAVAADKLWPTLEKILSGGLKPTERMRLAVRAERSGQVIFEAVVLNDVVLTKGALARIIDLTAAINGQHLTDYRADGLIVATPTGSTAYNLSAGGPILDPSLAAMILTPICPFTLANRPLVVAETARLSIKVGRRAEDVYLTCDGQEGLPLLPEDEVVVVRSQNLKLFPSPFQDYFSILRTKLGWGEVGAANARPCQPGGSGS